MDSRKLLVPMIVALIVASAVPVALYTSGNPSEDVSFTIIHTNDTHCFYEGDGGVGFPTVSALRNQYSAEGTVFTVDAGDFLQGNAYGTITKGEGSVEIMNTVGYDLCVPGNHEFDFGFDVFLERTQQLDFPIICANLVYAETGESVFDEYLILERGGARVGFFGLLTEQTPTTTMKGNMGPADVTDPAEAATRMVSVLEKEKVDCIVAVGHLGISKEGFMTSDMLCAAVPGIDIFIDGHSHTEMEDGKCCKGEPLVESGTLIASTGSYLHNVGVISYHAGDATAKLYRGPALAWTPTETVMNKVVTKADDLLKTVIGSTEVLLQGERGVIRNGETNLGDLVTDAFRSATGADVALTNSGGLRTSIAKGDITLKSVYDVMPFLNFVCTVEAPGSALWEEMEYSLALMGQSKGGFLQISGMTVTYDPDAEEGHKVLSITVNGKEVDKNATYKIATIDFIATGGDGNTFLQGYPIEMNTGADTIFADYIKSLGTISEETIKGGRLVAA